MGARDGLRDANGWQSAGQNSDARRFIFRTWKATRRLGPQLQDW
jgi:hypothetical protein